MKISFVVATVISVIGFAGVRAQTVLPSKTPPLPNFDKRTEATPASAARQTPPAGSAQAQGEARLRELVPDVQISRDKILGAARFVSVSRGFLTGPEGKGRAVPAARLAALPADDPHRVIKAFLNEHSAVFDHDARVLESARVERDYTTAHNGLKTTIWQQTLDGIPVFEALLTGHVTRNDELVSVSSLFVPDPSSAADSATADRRGLEERPRVSAATAIATAAANIGVEVAENDLTVAQAAQGAEQKQTFTTANLLGDSSAQLVWLPMNRNAMRLCWRVTITTHTGQRFVMLVDAASGEILLRRLLTVAAVTPATYNVYTNDSPSPMTPSLPTPATTQPTNVNRALIVTPGLSTNASPVGWVAEGPNPQTTGNNARAFRDRNFNLLPDVPSPIGTNRVFNFPLNLGQDPLNYASASTVQLFYRANWYHDMLYDLGFTEAAGNYQVDNFGRGGLGEDPVICLVQAGADVGFADNAFFIPDADGSPGYCAMFTFSFPTPDRDGSLDQEVVIHELTHGTSTRLVGGGIGISQLQSRGMGEGWSDFYAMCLLSESSDNVDATYATGGYVTYQFFGLAENYYFGIRRYPYSTDMTKNPLTFKDIDPFQASSHSTVPLSPLFSPFDPFSADEVHNQGEVWCMTLREVWASLVTKHGWEIGNKLTLQLVTDGMKLAPAEPNFLEARDAIIEADQVNTGGDNFVELWVAFAKRGMGYSATSPASETTIGVEEAFDVPPNLFPDGIFELTITPPAGDVFFSGETNSIFLRVSDGAGVINATIDATTDQGTNVVFRNDGIAPDQKASNAVYSASLLAPTNQSSVTITMVVSAPGKTTATNLVTYFVVAPPANDNFANATKVPVAGTNYLTSNKRATMELGEPHHAGVLSADASLWWNYVPIVNTNVLVDAGGSNFRGIIAVYTNNTVATLSNAVATAVGGAGRLGPFVRFSARAGVTYHIAVAAFSEANVGRVNLNIAPGGQPDTNAPTVSITAPANGLIVTTNRITVAAFVVDPSPNPTGIDGIFVNVSSSLGESETLPMLPPGSSLLGPTTTNWTRLVALQPGLNRIQVTASDFSGNVSPPTVAQVTYRVPGPPNDFFVNAITATNTSDLLTVNTANATKELGEPNHAGSLASHSAWWSYIPSADGVLSLTTSNSSFDTVLAIYQGTNVSQLTPIASNDDAYESVPGGYSQILQAVRSNQVYRIALDGFNDANGIGYLSYAFSPATVYHVSVSATAGGTVSPVSVDVQSNSIVALSAIPNANNQFDLWDGSVVSLNNPLSLVVRSDLSLTAHFRSLAFTDGFESGNLQHIPWTTNGPAVGNKPWVVQTSVVSGGQYAARSGNIGPNQTSSLLLTGSFRAGTGSFDYRVSSEPSFDVLRFLVDGIEAQHWSGEVDWANYAFPMTAGIHTLEWRYSKDPNDTGGLDAAFIDNVNLPLIVPTDSSSAANLQIQRQFDGSFFISVLGQTNQQYVLQVSTNLYNWQNVSTNIAVDGLLRIPDPSNVVTNTTRFYRAVAVPQ